ncbi:hypothetical protein FB639_004973, partial [Coemansia asiatica]
MRVTRSAGKSVCVFAADFTDNLHMARRMAVRTATADQSLQLTWAIIRGKGAIRPFMR